jgi:type VI secretion system protein ImpM
MPGIVTPNFAVGIFGKLPARADFVRLGLPRDFVDAWDNWLSAVMSATREQAGDAWLAAFLEAPVWRFALRAGICGTGAVLGLTIPSVDRAGRYFPLTLAAVGPAGGYAIDAAAQAWLDRCEDAGLAALEQDAGPETVRAMLGVPDGISANESGPATEWWTAGSPRVPEGRITLAGLPDAAIFTMMLGTQPTAEPLGEAHQSANPHSIITLGGTPSV